MAAAAEYGPLSLFIDGEWLGRDGREVLPVIDPATGEALGELPKATMADIERAIDAAANSFQSWKALTAYERSRVMERAADIIRERASAIAIILTREQGKPLRESLAEVNLAADTIEWHAEEGRRAYGRIIPPRRTGSRMMVFLEPIGPVAGFSGWNAPAQTPARKIGGALAAGCTIVLKPSEETPATALLIAHAFADAGLPKGVLNIVFGDPAAISKQLVESGRIQKITFTGSTVIGSRLAAQAALNLKRATMELGGHAPVLIFDDANIEKVAESAVAAKFRNSGQICTSPTRFFIQGSVYDRFTARFAEIAKNWRLGNGLDEETQMGPCANPRRVDAIEALVQDTVKRGGRILAGGRRLQQKGFFFAPTVIGDVPDDAAVMNEEPFGPLAVMRRFSDVEDGLVLANRLPFGLASYVFTNSIDIATKVSEGINAGNVILNNWIASTPETPFGGVRHSGQGSEGGIEGLHQFLVTKFVHQY
ncbi:MAG: NAD-dependent succinate-semialdehyde dehydrogenase [Xanthobacteraceae bacterium]|nr:NAD-dependent succinate-semialdehyde dehydrogenase [Xanthobacteraceae bacterium]